VANVLGIVPDITPEIIKERTSVTAVKNMADNNPTLLEWYIQVAENMLAIQNLDASLVGYNINVGFAVIKLVEYLVLSDDESTLAATTGPYSEEKFGSYSYKLKKVEEMVEKGWPPLVQRIIDMYRSVRSPITITITTDVFPQLPFDETTGIRPYRDFTGSRV